MHWLIHFLGLDTGSTSYYLFWSGVGSDITEVVIIAGVWRALNCHEDGCWRLGTRITTEDNGHHYRRCTKHHLVRHA